MSTSTNFSVVYDSFLSKITDDMYLQLTEEETQSLLKELLLSAIVKFEFPKKDLSYQYVEQEDLEEKFLLYQIYFSGLFFI